MRFFVCHFGSVHSCLKSAHIFHRFYYLLDCLVHRSVQWSFPLAQMETIICRVGYAHQEATFCNFYSLQYAFCRYFFVLLYLHLQSLSSLYRMFVCLCLPRRTNWDSIVLRGVVIGPLTPSTRCVYEMKLARVLAHLTTLHSTAEKSMSIFVRLLQVAIFMTSFTLWFLICCRSRSQR